MSYCLRPTVSRTIGEALEIAPQEPQHEGSGGLTESGGQATLRKKLDVEFRPLVPSAPATHHSLTWGGSRNR